MGRCGATVRARTNVSRPELAGKERSSSSTSKDRFCNSATASAQDSASVKWNPGAPCPCPSISDSWSKTASERLSSTSKTAAVESLMGWRLASRCRRSDGPDAQGAGEPVKEEPEIPQSQGEGREVGQGVGLDEVGIGAGVIGAGDVIRAAGGSEDYHRHSPDVRLLPDPFQHLKAGPVGEV